MRRLQLPLLVFACLGLLISQLSGLHMHVGADGYTGPPQHTHVHNSRARAHGGLTGHAADVDHDHPFDPGHPDDEDERDVSIVELSGVATKVLVFFAWLCLGLLLFSRRSGRIALQTVMPPLRMRRARWRPPLRAPPLPIVR